MAGSLDKSGIIEFFLVEAGEHIQSLNKGLLSLEKDPADTAMIDELFRAAHTLKGSAAMMGFQGVSDVAHKTEDMLGQFRSGTLPICKDTLNFLFDSVDAVKLMVDGVAGNQPEDRLVVESIGQAYKDVIDGLPKKEGAPPEEEAFTPPAQPALKKDDLDLAWEKTFEADEEEALAVEPLSEEAETPPAAPPQEMSPEPLPEDVTSAEEIAEAAPQPEEVPLRQEIEEAKKSGLHEKRGVGR